MFGSIRHGIERQLPGSPFLAFECRNWFMLEGYNIHVIRQPIVQNMRCTILLDTVSLIPMDLFILSMYICYWFEKSDMANVLLCKILFGALARIIPASSLQYLHAPVDSP